jgi:membrane-bound serine protease (ClpP class)
MILQKHRWWLALAVLIQVLMTSPPAAGAAQVSVLKVDGAIAPGNADYMVRGMARSARNGDQLLIIALDTPGGLDTSMRSVIKAILTSPVPVAVYISPSGARAASAGTYLLYASHIAAMAPGTNLGAATPVAVGMDPMGPERERQRPRGDADNQPLPPGPGGGKLPNEREPSSPMTQKQVHDAAAYIRGLAQMRGRNAEWAERAVREAVSLTADEALQHKVIEHVAADIPALLAQLDGRIITVQGQARRLATKGAAIIHLEPDWRTNVLAAITHPSVALLLMTIGIYGLIFEFMNPGGGVAGVIGAICLLLALYALQLLPVNYAGLGLIILGLIFMAAEAFLPSFGVLGLGGVVAFMVGALILVDTELPGYGIPPALIGTLGVTSALLIWGAARIALKTRACPVTSGTAGLIGAVAKVETMASGATHEGWVRIEGELWHAVSGAPLHQAQTVRIVAREGLTLRVAPEDPPPGG